MKQLLLLIAFVVFSSITFAQRLNTPKPSPEQTITQDFGVGTIKLSYSRPGLKGRHIGTEFVPYGQLWRTGANGATTVEFSNDVTIGDRNIKAGKYGLLSIPQKQEWIIIITSDLDVNSPVKYNKEHDVVRVKVAAKELSDTQETFTISFSDFTASSCVMQLIWDQTLVEIPIETNSDELVMNQIDKIFNEDDKPYYSAAQYYFDTNRDLKQAKEWIDIESAKPENSDKLHIWMLKAEIYNKLGYSKETKEICEKIFVLADKWQNDDYRRKAQTLLESK